MILPDLASPRLDITLLVLNLALFSLDSVKSPLLPDLASSWFALTELMLHLAWSTGSLVDA